jgi:glycosyltransferase involved in cell wall biosynthesis
MLAALLAMKKMVPAADFSVDGRAALRVLFVSPHSLLDPTSGASKNVAAMLQGLAQRGVPCGAVTATAFDRPEFPDFRAWLKGLGATYVGPPDGLRLITLEKDGVRHILFDVGPIARDKMTSIDEYRFFRTVRKLCRRTRPDVVFTFGGLLLEREICRWLKLQNIPIVFCLLNSSYYERDPFELASAIITDSFATADLYKNRLGLSAENMALFIPGLENRRQSRGDCVTFINPTPHKGAIVFAGLVEKMQNSGARFLVINSRAKFSDFLSMAGLSQSLLNHVECLPVQSDMEPIYMRTKVLLVPSLWHESAGLVALEALAHGIPVVASNCGGLPETLMGGGTIIPMKERRRSELLTPVTDEEIAPWYSALSKLLSEPGYYAQEVARARKAFQCYDFSRNVDRLLQFLQDLVEGMKHNTQMGQGHSRKHSCLEVTDSISTHDRFDPPITASSQHDLYLSPHLDDICLSLGGFVRRRKTGVLLTIFSRSDFVCRAMPLPSDKNDRVMLISEIRRAENEAFAQRVGLLTRYGELAEALVRGRDAFDAAKATEDTRLLHTKVMVAIEKLKTPEPLNEKPWLFCPIGIGNHLDHLIILRVVVDNLASLKSTYRIAFYEDHPYATDRENYIIGIERLRTLLAPLEPKRRVHPISDVIDDKLRFARLYDSQFVNPPTSLASIHEAVWTL